MWVQPPVSILNEQSIYGHSEKICLPKDRILGSWFRVHDPDQYIYRELTAYISTHMIMQCL